MIANPQPFFLHAWLYSILPLLILHILAFIWQMAPHDWRGIGNFFD